MVTKVNDVYRQFYTKSSAIVSYMVTKLSLDSGMKVLEPCAGDGIFIDALLNLTKDISIDAYELNPDTIELLRAKYKSTPAVSVIHEDTLTSLQLDILLDGFAVYDRIIANPPYGGWLEYDKRKYLKKLYPLLYTKETYTLFLYRCIRLLKDEGILVFIIPDTFLNLHMHSELRKYLLTNTKIREICMFPSSFFPDISFGYSNMCIVTLEKCSNINDCLDNEIKIITGLNNVNDLVTVAQRVETYHRLFTITQKHAYRNASHALLFSDNPGVIDLVTSSSKYIGDIADCVTGFYSGNDKKYLHPLSNEVKNARQYEIVDRLLICDNYHNRRDILEGIPDPKHFIPIVKGGGIKFFKPDTWFMDWGIEAVRDYKTNKKARFQNARYYFSSGIGIPMVSSSQVTAALIDNRLFDQSIVGVFPKEKELLYYLLGFFNSPTCNKLIRTINPSANSSANYIKKIPFITPSEAILQEVTEIVKSMVSRLRMGENYSVTDENKVYDLIAETYHISNSRGTIPIRPNTN